MKIGVVGCGAVGGYYGAMLCRAGHVVHLLLRADYEPILQKGLHILSPQGDFTVRPHCERTPDEIGTCDVVLIALKTTANHRLQELVTPLVGPETSLVTLQNGLGNEALLAGFIPPKQILGGLCFVCLNRITPGVVRHAGHGLIVLGDFTGGPTANTQTLADQFHQAGVPCQLTDHLERAHWEKLTWNIPFNGLGVASAAGLQAFESAAEPREVSALGECLTTDRLLADPRWEIRVRELIREVIAAANAMSLGLKESLEDEQLDRTRIMGAYRASTLVDFERGLPLELEALFLEPLRQARAAGIPTPRLARLCAVLTALDKRRPNLKS